MSTDKVVVDGCLLERVEDVDVDAGKLASERWKVEGWKWKSGRGGKVGEGRRWGG
jgi:hypothetical protein